VKVTEQDRIAARESKSRMSEKTAARLAAVNESDRQGREAQKRFAEQFEKMPHDMWTLQELLLRMSTDEDDLERRALKLRRCLAMGWKVRNTHDVLFFATLTDGEVHMSDEQFYNLMTSKWPEALKQAPKRCSDRQKTRSKSLLKSMVWGDTRLTHEGNPHGAILCA
jgi:hypothetical protein